MVVDDTERQERDADTRLLIERIRSGLWLVIGANVLFALADLRYAGPRLWEVWALKLAGLGAVLATFALLRRCRSQRGAEFIALSLVAAGAGLGAVSGAVSQDALTTPILSIVVALVTAMMLPWSTGAQVACSVILGLSILLNGYLVSGQHPLQSGYPLIAIVVALTTSALAARQLERHRRALARNTLELRRTADALSDSERRYREVFENANDMIFTHDLHGRITSCNRAAERLTGYPRAELLRMNVADLLLPEHAAEVEEKLERVRRTDPAQLRVVEPTPAVRRIRTRDGRIVTFEVNSQLLFEGGVPVAVEGVARDVTARLQAETALRESERRLRDVAAHIPGLVYQFQLNRDGSYSFPLIIEGPYLKMLGLSVTEMQANPASAFEIIHPDDLEPLWRLLGQMKPGVPPEPAEFRVRTQSGEHKWLRATSTVQALPDGALLSTGLLIDITDRKQAEERARQLAAIVESSEDPIIGLTLDDVITSWNAGAERLYGHRAAEVIGRRFSDLLMPGRADELGGVLQRIQRGERIHQLETRHRRGDGGWVHVSLTVSPVKDESGRIVGASIIARDISGRRMMEEALRKAHGDLERRVEERTAELSTSNALLRREIDERQRAEQELIAARESALESSAQFSAVLNSVGEGIVTIDSSGRIVMVNREVEKIWGYSREQLVGSSVEMLMPEASRGPHAAGFQRYRETGHSQILGRRIELEGLHADGRTFPLELCVVETRIGPQTYFTAAVRDISERKRVEAALQEAKEVAEAANRAKSEFLANVSHEIRTPMNAVIGMTGLLLDTNLTREQREFADTIRSASAALLTLINDLLDFSKIESGALELEAQPFALDTCVEEALDLLAPKAAQQGVELASFIDDDVPEMIIGDVGRLRQVLVNLLSNAVRFTHHGEVTVSVSLAERSGDGSPVSGTGRERDSTCEVCFAVRDTGIGIPKERFNRLFQSFSQVDASTTRRYGGTGLGLAISKRLVEAMGGRIWVESQVGIGSTFSFTIQALRAEPRQSLRGPQKAFLGKRVLVIEHHPTHSRVLHQHIRGWGMEPCPARSGIEALGRIRRGEVFDAAILDMQMPELDGLALAGEIRVYRDATALPLVILTSLGRLTEHTEPPEGSVFLSKPVKASELYRAFTHFFAGSPAPDRPRSAPTAIQRLADSLPLRILLAEDNEVNQRVGLRILARLGYRADVAANGFEALQALKRQPYDLVLMDVQMPEMDGLQAARQICETWPPAQRPRIIAMTAHAMQASREECLAAGMDDYISKPVDIDELRAALERWGTRPGAAEPGQVNGANASETIDRSAFERLRKQQEPGEADLVAELIEVFLKNAPAGLEALREAVASSDPLAVNDAAHRLKSGSAQLGATRMAMLCSELEQLGGRSTLEGAPRLFGELEQEFNRVREELDRERKKVASDGWEVTRTSDE